MPKKRKRDAKKSVSYQSNSSKKLAGKKVWVPASNASLFHLELVWATDFNDPRLRLFADERERMLRERALACGDKSEIQRVMEKVTTNKDEKLYPYLVLMLAANNHLQKLSFVREVGRLTFPDGKEAELADIALKRVRFDSSDVAGCSNVGVKKSAAGNAFVPISDIFTKPQNKEAELDVVIVEGAEADVARTLAKQLPTSDGNLAIL